MSYTTRGGSEILLEKQGAILVRVKKNVLIII